MQDLRCMDHNKIVTNGKNAWFFSKQLNSLAVVDLVDGRTEFLVDANDITKKRSFCGLFYYDNHVYLLPFDTDELVIYSITDNRSQVIRLPQSDKCFFTGAIYRDGCIYMFGNREPIICKYEIKTGKIKLLSVRNKMINLLPIHNEWFWTEAFIRNGIIYLVMINNILVSINGNDELGYILLGSDVETWNTRNIIIDGGIIKAIHAGEKPKIYLSRYDLSGKMIDISEYHCDEQWSDHLFIHAEYSNGKWYVFPYRSDAVFSIDSDSGQIAYCQGSERSKTVERVYYTDSVLFDNKIYAINQVTEEMVCVDSLHNAISTVKLEYSEGDINKIIQNNMIYINDIINERRNYYTLDNFLLNLLRT